MASQLDTLLDEWERKSIVPLLVDTPIVPEFNHYNLITPHVLNFFLRIHPAFESIEDVGPINEVGKWYVDNNINTIKQAFECARPRWALAISFAHHRFQQYEKPYDGTPLDIPNLTQRTNTWLNAYNSARESVKAMFNNTANQNIHQLRDNLRTQIGVMEQNTVLVISHIRCFAPALARYHHVGLIMISMLTDIWFQDYPSLKSYPTTQMGHRISNDMFVFMRMIVDAQAHAEIQFLPTMIADIASDPHAHVKGDKQLIFWPATADQANQRLKMDHLTPYSIAWKGPQTEAITISYVQQLSKAFSAACETTALCPHQSVKHPLPVDGNVATLEQFLEGDSTGRFYDNGQQF